MTNATRVAKPRKKRKTVGAWLHERIMPPTGEARGRIDPAIERGVAKVGAWLRKKIIPPPSERPGQMDYPAITKAIEAQRKRRKLLDEVGR
jgi:hypothetical protein